MKVKYLANLIDRTVKPVNVALETEITQTNFSFCPDYSGWLERACLPQCSVSAKPHFAAVPNTSGIFYLHNDINTGAI